MRNTWSRGRAAHGAGPNERHFQREVKSCIIVTKTILSRCENFGWDREVHTYNRQGAIFSSSGDKKKEGFRPPRFAELTCSAGGKGLITTRNMALFAYSAWLLVDVLPERQD